jgi:hypothetical protein
MAFRQTRKGAARRYRQGLRDQPFGAFEIGSGRGKLATGSIDEAIALQEQARSG